MTPEKPELNVVTGAFGYTGRYITKQLLSMGVEVRTLTSHLQSPNPFGQQVSVAPLDFKHPRQLAENLRGATTLYNTYWIRFNHKNVTFDDAIDNTITLIRAASEAGVRKIVHVSITNASQESPFPYFKAKAIVEQAVIESGLSYGIVRPTLIFGWEDILINNIAWLLRRFPVFVAPSKSDCLIQPVYVKDVADLAVDAGRQKNNSVADAVGPDVYTFDQLIRLIAASVGSRARVVRLNRRLVLLGAKLLGFLVNDTVLTRDEVDGLLSNLLVSSRPATGHTSLTDWLSENANYLGTRYTSELSRHYR